MNIAAWCLLCCITFKVEAQLSGTKVIGSAPSDYTTFTAAVNALNSQGISASVIFEVKPGTYNEQITINNISGASATKTITFRSQNLDTASVKLVYASSGSASNNFVVFLDDADYVTFDHLTIWRTGSSNYAQVFDISNGATYNTIQNCRVIGTTATSTTIFTALVGSTNTLEDSYNVFDNNRFEGGAYGLYFLGRGSTMLDAGLEVTNNQFVNQNFKGIYITCMDAPLISGNVVTTTSANNNYYGIYGQYANNEVQILKNKLALSTGYGIYLTNSEGLMGAVLLVANNFISIAGSSANYGIYLNQVKNTNFYYNSVNLTGSTGGRAFYINGATSQSNEVINNIFSNQGGGYAIYIDPTTGTPMLECDYNDLYSTGTNVGYWKSSGNQTNLANWQTASSFDANSLSVDPSFVSSTDLHVQNGALNGQATVNLSSATPVTDDIDGTTRSTSFPDIGADEFSIENIGVSSLGMDASYCQNTLASIKIYIRNYTAYTFQGTVPVFYSLNGGTFVNATTGTITIDGNDSVLYQFTTQALLSDAGNIPLLCGTSLSIDIAHANDTLYNATVNVLPAPAADAGDDNYVCLGDSAILTASGGVSYLWNTMPPQSTATIHVLVNDTTQYIVQVTGANGCLASDTVLVIPGNYPKPVADFSYVLFDMQMTFTDLSSDAYGWDWDFGDGNYSTDQNPVHVYTANGNYNVTLIAYNGCDGDTITKSLTVIGVSETPLESVMSLIPNPANRNLTISVPSNVTLHFVRITDLTGRKVFELNGNIPEVLDVSTLEVGVYQVTIGTDVGNALKKLVIQR
jgi:PKD repeat protein